jgi:heme A synthase
MFRTWIELAHRVTSLLIVEWIIILCIAVLKHKCLLFY